MAVFVANAVAAYLQPSLYESMIKIKNLPYLPTIVASNSLFVVAHHSLCPPIGATPLSGCTRVT